MAKKKVDDKDVDTLVRQALIDKAIGYTAEEITEEYGFVDEEMKLLKKKRSLKVYPPDMSAISMILDKNDSEYSSFSNEELEKEKIRLIKLLKRSKDETKRD